MSKEERKQTLEIISDEGNSTQTTATTTSPSQASTIPASLEADDSTSASDTEPSQLLSQGHVPTSPANGTSTSKRKYKAKRKKSTLLSRKMVQDTNFYSLSDVHSFVAILTAMNPADMTLATEFYERNKIILACLPTSLPLHADVLSFQPPEGSEGSDETVSPTQSSHLTASVTQHQPDKDDPAHRDENDDDDENQDKDQRVFQVGDQLMGPDCILAQAALPQPSRTAKLNLVTLAQQAATYDTFEEDLLKLKCFAGLQGLGVVGTADSLVICGYMVSATLPIIGNMLAPNMYNWRNQSYALS